MNKEEAENYVYQSYLKAEKHQKYNTKDENKRDPSFSRDIIRKMSKTPCVVVTGSKGKGSVSSMISQILQTKQNVGLMTSPHLVDFCERFRINGEAISDKDFIKHIEEIRPIFDNIETLIPREKFISPMGIQTALALSYFNEKNTQFNIFECGKGAKLDDVNNVPHKYAIINSIFMEHTRELGNTLKEIAYDKSHVISGEQECIYIAEQKADAMNVIRERANFFNTPIKVYGMDFRSENIQYTHHGMKFDVIIGEETYKNILIPLLGEHQAKNCALAMSFCKDILKTLNTSNIKENFKSLSWPGRMEIISSNPFVMLDACINSESTDSVKKTLDFLNIQEYTIIVGIPDDKDFAKVVKSMQKNAACTILTKSQNPHYIFSENQRHLLANNGINTIWTNSVSEAIAIAKNKCLPIVILGTTSIVSEVKAYFDTNSLGSF